MNQDTQTDPGKVVCGLCGSTNIWHEHNVGWDVSPEGEEYQHLEHCGECGGWRFRIDHYDLSGVVEIHHGQWQKKDGYGSEVWF